MPKIDLRLVIAIIGGYYLMISAYMYFGMFNFTGSFERYTDSEYLENQEVLSQMAMDNYERLMPSLMLVAGCFLIIAMVFDYLKRVTIPLLLVLTLAFVYWIREYTIGSNALMKAAYRVIVQENGNFETIMNMILNFNSVVSVAMLSLPLILLWGLIILKSRKIIVDEDLRTPIDDV